MLSISFGPIAVSVSLLITTVGIIIFWILSHWLLHNKPPHAQALNGIFKAVVAGFIIARIGFIIKLWPAYQEQWWQIVNVRDGGFIPYYGWLAGIVVLIASSRGKKAISKTYLQASISALCVILPLKIAVHWYSSDVTIPQIPVREKNGTLVNLQTYIGKPIVINYWASWCPPCRREMPVLQAAQKHHSSMSFLFINQGEDHIAAERFLASEDLHLNNIFYDPASQLSRASGAAGLPTTLFFDASGKLIASHMGELSNASLSHYLQLFKANESLTKEKP
ncbi:TlpA disulfide reductase family protein [Aliiglaciecola sp. LCG003]|uniref:TlpA disulfide reductase family protein n=1 Tax=Aliiglaciecola sp. LCG003 TaxID=3053655 RepID=UPI0025732DCE|nr:TlpA disulfide reductase family protein [Aliiglaciecola sp. LCG003]WJG10765.1 TlpA disulfide reductase family protein [Aliiglaciecola sp. LCG003]